MEEQHQRAADGYIIKLVESVAELKVQMDHQVEDMKEIKETIKEIKQNMTNQCKDCEVHNALDKHLEEHDKSIDRKWVIIGIVVASLLSAFSLLLQIL